MVMKKHFGAGSSLLHSLLATLYRAQQDNAQAQQEMKTYADLQQKSTNSVAQRAAEAELLTSNHP